MSPQRAPKLAFSTLGCPDWTWTEILTNGPAAGYQGVEIRLIARETNLLAIDVFRQAERVRRKRELADVGLVACGVEVVAGEVNPIPEIVTLLQLLERFGDGFAHLSSQIIEPSRNSEIDFDAATVHHINKGIANLNTLMHDLLDEMIFHERELDEEAEELQRQVEGKEAA